MLLHPKRTQGEVDY